MSTIKTRSASQTSPVINVTPLIDVLLVLLIIIMVIAPLQAARFKAMIPQQPAKTPLRVGPNPLTPVVTIDKNLRLILNQPADLGTAGEPARLADELFRVLRGREAAGTPRLGVTDLSSLPPSGRVEKTVFIKAPRSIRYGEVARLIDAIKGAGANPVGLQIDELDE